MKVITKLVYIAGPYTAPTQVAIRRNIAVAEAAARQLALNQIGFICPHLNSRNMHNVPIPPDFWYQMYLYQLSLCHAVLTLPNWQRSCGATAEIAYAEKLKLPVYHSIDEILSWAKNGYRPAGLPRKR